MPGRGYQQPTQTRPSERLLARQARHSSGRLQWNDIDIARSIWGPFVSDPRYLFDGDMEKAVNVPAGVPPPITIYFKKPHFIGHSVVMSSDPLRFDTTLGAVITWIAVDGGAVPAGASLATLADRTHITPPAWPAPMIGVTIQMSAGAGAASNTSEIIMEVCPCVTASVVVAALAPIIIDQGTVVKHELYAANGTVAQSFSLDTGARKLKQYLAKSNTAGTLHTWTVDYSFDNITWYNQYTSAAPEQSISKTVESPARYWRISSDAVVGAHTVDLILAAIE